MVKRILFFIMISFGLIGCGINCSSKPPRIAYIYSDVNYGMRYHIGIFPPYGDLSHSGGCTKYEYASSHLYLDRKSGMIKGDEIVWKNIFGEDLPIEERGGQLSNITVIIKQDTVEVKGSFIKLDNGIYKIETSSPGSWGVPIS